MFAVIPAIAGGNCSFETGTYVGNGEDNRDIDIGVNLSAKTDVYVIIKGVSQFTTVHRIEYGQGDLTMMFCGAPLGDPSDFANFIQAFTETGFQVGTQAQVNTNGTTYRYIAFWTE